MRAICSPHCYQRRSKREGFVTCHRSERETRDIDSPSKLTLSTYFVWCSSWLPRHTTFMIQLIEKDARNVPIWDCSIEYGIIAFGTSRTCSWIDTAVFGRKSHTWANTHTRIVGHYDGRRNVCQHTTHGHGRQTSWKLPGVLRSQPAGTTAIR